MFKWSQSKTTQNIRIKQSTNPGEQPVYRPPPPPPPPRPPPPPAPPPAPPAGFLPWLNDCLTSVSTLSPGTPYTYKYKDNVYDNHMI